MLLLLLACAPDPGDSADPLSGLTVVSEDNSDNPVAGLNDDWIAQFDEGDVAWVATESLLEAKEDGKDLLLLSTETMLLRKTDAGWTIVHIHWSSRKAPKD